VKKREQLHCGECRFFIYKRQNELTWGWCKAVELQRNYNQFACIIFEEREKFATKRGGQ